MKHYHQNQIKRVPESPTTSTRTCPQGGPPPLCSLFSLSRSLQNMFFPNPDGCIPNNNSSSLNQVPSNAFNLHEKQYNSQMAVPIVHIRLNQDLSQNSSFPEQNSTTLRTQSLKQARRAQTVRSAKITKINNWVFLPSKSFTALLLIQLSGSETRDLLHFLLEQVD